MPFIVPNADAALMAFVAITLQSVFGGTGNLKPSAAFAAPAIYFPNSLDASFSIPNSLVIILLAASQRSVSSVIPFNSSWTFS